MSSKLQSRVLTGFALSIALHAIVVLFVGAHRPPEARVPGDDIIRLAQEPTPTPHPLTVRTPTPTPRMPAPEPTRTPHVRRTMIPRKPTTAVHPRPRALPRRIDAPRTSTDETGQRAGAPTGARPGAQVGSGNMGGGDSLAGAGNNATATFTPTASPTPKPACDRPNVEARTLTVVEPDMPTIAVQEGATGEVGIRVDLSATGSVVGTAIERSSGNAALDAAARDAAQRSTFAPEIDDCMARGGTCLFHVDFSM